MIQTNHDDYLRKCASSYVKSHDFWANIRRNNVVYHGSNGDKGNFIVCLKCYDVGIDWYIMVDPVRGVTRTEPSEMIITHLETDHPMLYAMLVLGA